jgi:hypothetical protein
MQQPDSVGPFDTHWSRILHYDLSTAHPDGYGRGAEAHRREAPNRTATTRLAVFVALYTAVAGVVHFLFWPDAAAVVPDGFPATASVAALSNPSAVPEDLLQSEAPCAAAHPSKDMYEQIIDAD